MEKIKYTNEGVRRQDRLLAEAEAFRLLEHGEYGVLSMVTPDGTAYGVPVNYVWDGQCALYVHCAPEGKKLRCLSIRSRVSFCIIGHTHVLPDKFTTEYESIVLVGEARIGLQPDERKHALELLLRKYSPDDLTVGLKYAGKSFPRTEIIRLDIVEMSGKSKRMRP